MELDSKFYFSKVSRLFLEQNDASKFVYFVTEQLSFESERIKFLWPTDLEAAGALMKVCEVELIDFHKSILQQEFERMLQFERSSEVKILFSLLKKNESTSQALQQSLSVLIAKELETASGAQPRLLVEKIIEIYAKFSVFVCEAFENDQKMLTALEDSIQNLINSKIKAFWKLLSVFIDERLKPHNQHLSPQFHQFLRLFVVKSDCFDEFMIDFKEKFAYRLIYQDFDLNSETEIIGTLKQTGKLSPEQNCHLNRMLTDYEIRDEAVLVLTSHAWPSSCNPVAMNDSLLPESLKSIISNFESGYRDSHCGRKLNWCPQLTTVETGNGCLMTLLQFVLIQNLPCSEDLDDISRKIGVSVSDVRRALKPLIEHSVISLDSNTNNFEFEKLSNNLNLIPLYGEDEASTVFTNSKISNETSNFNADLDSNGKLRRAFILQSLVASILKHKRQISPAELKKIVASNAANMKFGHSFNPSYEDLSDAINNLIGKGYAEFNTQDNLYIYVP